VEIGIIGCPLRDDCQGMLLLYVDDKGTPGD
jgi:hypothetical protein